MPQKRMLNTGDEGLGRKDIDVFIKTRDEKYVLLYISLDTLVEGKAPSVFFQVKISWSQNSTLPRVNKVFLFIGLI